MLGLLIEKVTGMSYESYVRTAILEPAGATKMVFGRTPLAQRDPLEVTCYDGLAPVTGPFGTGKWCDVMPFQEYAHAAGAWVATASDMARWISVVDGAAGGRPDVLSASTIASMTARPSYAPTGAYYALGWQVIAEAGGTTWVHSGAQTGGDGYVTKLPNGLVMVILTNLTRGQGAGGGTLDPALNQAVRQITSWPTGTPF
jgi:CubicO group peptidase (beta-lactamase class C family)